MLFGTAKAVPEVILIATLCNLWGPGKVPGPAHFDDHFLNWDSRLIVIGGSRLYTSPNNGWLDWMPETSNCVSQSAHFEPPFHVKMKIVIDIYIYIHILIALIIGNGG